MRKIIAMVLAGCVLATAAVVRADTGTLGLTDRLAGLVRQLNSCDPSEGREAARELASLGAEATPAVPYLIRRHENHDRAFRAAVIDALGAIGDSRAVEVLIHSLSAHAELRGEVLQALAKTSGEGEKTVGDWFLWWEKRKDDQSYHTVTAKRDGEIPGKTCLGGTCHSDVMAAPSARHEPMRDALCTRCHLPGKDFDPANHDMFSLDFSDLGEVCLSCHGDLKTNLVEARVVHAPVGLGLCDSCHAPHGGMGEAFLKMPCGNLDIDMNPWMTRGISIQCVYCHKVEHFDNSNPEATDFRQGGKNLHALHLDQKSIEIECADCHDTHASGQAHIMRDAKRLGKGSFGVIEYRLATKGGTCVTECHGKREYRK